MLAGKEPIAARRKVSRQLLLIDKRFLGQGAVGMTHEPVQRRSNERVQTFLEGRVVLDDRSSFIECAVWDISDTGARIGFLQPAEVPLEFELQIPQEGAAAQVRLVWSTGKEHGVAFTDEPTLQP